MKKDLVLKAMRMPANIKRYENKWVAMDLDRKKVLVSGSTLAAVDKQAEKLTKSPDKYVLSRVVDPKTTFSPYVKAAEI